MSDYVKRGKHVRTYAAIAVLLLIGSAQALNLTVCPNGCGYDSIQAAINAANSGDIIEIYSGDYLEHVIMNKNITLKGINNGGGNPSIETMHLCGYPESSASGLTFFFLDFGCPSSKQSNLPMIAKDTKNISMPSITMATYSPISEENRKMLYYDSFSISLPVIYPKGYNREYTAAYKSGRYHIIVSKPNYISIVDPTGGAIFDDFTIEVEAAQDGGPNDGDCGVILRRIDENSYYRFMITGNGYYGFDKFQNGNRIELVPLTKSKDIRSENEKNNIKIGCYGNHFTFNVNENNLSSFIDSSFAKGGIGLEVGTQSVGGVHVSFDNLKVWA